MKELLSELKNACRDEPSRSDIETIGHGQSTWFKGRPTHAPEGTVALALSEEARIIINDGDVLAVKKRGEYYSVEVSSDANFLLRIDKVMKATTQRDRGCGGIRPPMRQARHDRKDGAAGIEIDEVEVCDLVCGEIVLAGIRIPVCIPANCKTTKA